MARQASVANDEAHACIVTNHTTPMDVPDVTKWSLCLVTTRSSTDTAPVTSRVSGSTAERDAIVGYRAFVAVVVAAYFTLIALTPRVVWMPDVSWAQLLPLSVLYLALGIWGFDHARRRRSSLLITVVYLLIEFAIGMRINTLAWGGGLPADSAAARSASRYPAAAPISTTHVVGSPAPAHRPASRG